MKKRLHFVAVALNGTIASTLLGPIELVQACDRLQAHLPELEPCEVVTQILSPDGAPYLSSSGYRLPVDGGLTDLPPHSAILVPGFGLPQPEQVPQLLDQHSAFGGWLKRQHESGSTLVAAGSGNLFLAEHNLLRRKKATTYWVYADLFRERYPHITLDLDAPIIEDDRVFSVGGTVCGVEAVLTLIQRSLGKEVTRLCTKLLLMENRRPSELRYEKRQPAQHEDPLVDRAVKWIRENLHSRLSMEDLLHQVPTSRRNLSRRFKLETGEAIQEFIQRLRMDRAKMLLETSSVPIEQIVDQIGYSDPSAFARQFKRYTHFTPRGYRERYGLSQPSG